MAAPTYTPAHVRFQGAMFFHYSPVPGFHEVEVNTLALHIVRDAATTWGEIIVEASLASLPFGEVSLSISDLLSSHLSAGVLSILFFSSIYFLMSERTFLSLIGS